MHVLLHWIELYMYGGGPCDDMSMPKLKLKLKNHHTECSLFETMSLDILAASNPI